MSVAITESGVTFGPFAEDRLYYIEKSDSYAGLGKGFSTVEFIFINRKNQLCFVEAKSSSPRKDRDADRFDEWVKDVITKFDDSLQLFLTVYLERRNETDMGTKIRNAEMKTLPMLFILVLPHHQLDWLAPIKNELDRQLHKVTEMWNVTVSVMNEELAKEYGMIA